MDGEMCGKIVKTVFPIGNEYLGLVHNVLAIFFWQIGREREVAVCLMQKAIDKGPELQIRSVVALDHLKNYIYIEADKEAHVKEVCSLPGTF